MKKLLTIMLALVMSLSIATLFTACGAKGDTNMHKLREAIVDDQVITKADEYLSNSQLSERDSSNYNVSQNYTCYNAWTKGGNNDYLQFGATALILTENGIEKDFGIDISWNANDNTIDVRTTSYDYGVYNSSTKRYERAFETHMDRDASGLVFDMNKYYENGKFEVADASRDLTDTEVKVVKSSLISGVEPASVIKQDMVDLINKAFDGLNTIYKAKGFPIK